MANLNLYTFDQLRALGSRYKIPRYSRLSKADLIAALEQIPNLDAGKYQTIFEKIKQKTGGKAKTREWYQTELSLEMQQIAGDTSLFDQELMDANTDTQEFADKNQIIPPIPGRLTFFRYKAKTARQLLYYDRYPLCYILKNGNGFFYGINLHYFNPRGRLGIATELKERVVPQLEKGVHKYLISELRSPILGLAMSEWETATLLPVEEFVRNLGGVEIPINPKLVWR